MKKSVKILIIVLCLIILGLVTFIVVDKFIIKESNVNTIVTENSTETSNELKHNPKNSTIIDSYIGNTYVNTDYSEQQIKINSISNNTLNFDLVIGDDYGDYTVNANASIEKNKASFNIENMLMQGTLTFKDEKIIMDITEGSNQFFNTGDKFEYIKLNNTSSKNGEETSSSNNTENETDKANEAIRKALKDEKWLQENIIMDNENLKDEDKTLTFICLKKEDDGTPLVIVSNRYYADWEKTVLVSYKNSQVTTEVITDGSMRETLVDSNKNAIAVNDSHMGVTTTSFSKVENKKITFLEWVAAPYTEEDEIGYSHSIGANDSQEITKEEYESILKKYYSSYTFVPIDIELTNENIDKYVK